MGKECGAWVSRRLWGGGNTSPLKTTAWEATVEFVALKSIQVMPLVQHISVASINSIVIRMIE